MNKSNNISKLAVFKNEQGNVSDIHTNLFVVSEKRGDYFFISSPDLRVYGKSKTSTNLAEKDFDRAVGNFLSIHVGRGSLEQTLSNFH